MIRQLSHRFIVITISIFFFNVSICQEIISEEEIAEMAEKIDEESAGLSLIDGVVMRGCKSHKRRIIFQYDVVDNWIPGDNIKEQLEKNASNNPTFKKFCDKNEIDKTFVYYYPSGEVAKMVTLFHDKDSELSFSLGDFVSIKGHKKSKGIDLKLRCPVDWKVEEADRPNIVKKFVFKKTSFMIITSENETFFSRSEAKELFENNKEELISNMSEGLENGNMSNINVLESKVVSIDNYPALEFDFTGLLINSVLDKKMKFFCKQWTVFYEDKGITFMGMNIGNSDGYNNVFKMICNSVVFPEQYLD